MINNQVSEAGSPWCEVPVSWEGVSFHGKAEASLRRMSWSGGLTLMRWQKIYFYIGLSYLLLEELLS